MTREEAIRIIKIVLAVAEDFEITVQGEEFTEEKCKEAVDMAITALKQEPCTDAISNFEGMTNGEVIKAVFNNDAFINFLLSYEDHYWWDAPYKASPTGAEGSE